MVDRDRILTYANEVDEYEADVVLLERAIAALPSKSREKELMQPWHDGDRKASPTRFLSCHVYNLGMYLIRMLERIGIIATPRCIEERLAL